MNQTEFVGVDTHKNTLACYVNGRFKEFPNTLKGFQSAVKWAGVTNWAIEGAYCFGRAFSAYLIENGHKVYEVNPLLTKSWRQVLSINGKKNDYGDAKVISMFAHREYLQPVSLATVHLKEKLTARKLLVKQRTQIINSIKMLFTARGKVLPVKKLSTNKAEKWLIRQDDAAINELSKVLISLNQSIKKLGDQIAEELPEKAANLMKLKGIKSLTAAAIYANTKGKLASRAALASYSGVAPVECSSGKKSRHKINHGGNRDLNAIFFRLSSIQSRKDEEGKRYYEKKLKEGKSPRLARKHLARQLVNQVWKILKDDSQVKTGTKNIPVLTA